MTRSSQTKMVRPGILYILLPLLAVSCASADRDAQARTICACLRPLDSLNAALPEALAQGDAEAGMDQLLVLAEAAGEARNCLDQGDLPEPDVWGDDAAMKALLDRDCPGWEAILAALPPQ